MIELVDEYGPEEIMRYLEAILDYADRRTADEIRSMPDENTMQRVTLIRMELEIQI